MSKQHNHAPVDLGRLFPEMRELAPAGWSVTVQSGEHGEPAGVIIVCNDSDQHAEVVRRLDAGLFGPVREDEA